MAKSPAGIGLIPLPLVEFRALVVAQSAGEDPEVQGAFLGLIDRCIAAEASRSEGVAAAELALEWMHDPAENVTERFDRIADQFRRETGFTRPGRSIPLAAGGEDEEARRSAWDAWCVARNEKVRLALVAFVAKARGR